MPSFFKKKRPPTSQFNDLKNPVSPDMIMGNLEQFFGILNHKMGGSTELGPFLLVTKTGCRNIYGITSASIDTSKGTYFHVKRLDELKAFLNATDYDAKKSLLLKHASEYVEVGLNGKDLSIDDLKALKPLIKMIKDSFIQEANGLLEKRHVMIKRHLPDKIYASKKAMSKPWVADVENHIKRLGQLSSLVTGLILKTLDIDEILKVHAQGDEEQTSTLLLSLVKSVMEVTPNAVERLTDMTCEDYTADLLKQLNRESVVLSCLEI